MNPELDEMKRTATVSERALISTVERLVRNELSDKADAIAKRERKVARDELFRDNYWMPRTFEALERLALREGLPIHLELKHALDRAREEFKRDHPES